MQIGPAWSRAVIAALIGAVGALVFALSTPWLASSKNQSSISTNNPNLTANNDTYSTPEDSKLSVPAPGVLENDSYPSNSLVTATLQTNVSSGSLDLNPNGSFIYTPTLNYNGQDFFTYAISDGIQLSNSATVTITVFKSADLEITKSASPDPVFIGQNLNYIIRIKNHGPSDAASVVITDTLPASVDYLSVSPTNVNCPVGTPLICTVGDMGENQQVAITITVKTTQDGMINNLIQVGSNVPDPQVTNNTASASTTVRPLADLKINKTGDPDPVLSGGRLTYQLQVMNNGPSIASGVILSDTLPAQVSYLNSTVPEGAFCSSNAGQFTCSLGNLNAGSSRQLSLDVRVDPVFVGDLSNQAIVTSSTQDPNPSDNLSTLPTSVKAGSKLADPQWVSPVSDEGIYFVINGTVPLVVNITGIDPSDLHEVVFYRWDAMNFKYVNIAIVDGSQPPYQATLDARSLNFAWNEVRVRAIDTGGNPSDYRFIWIYRLYTNFLPKVNK